ncbi:MAG: hydrolase [Opitutae bacterium]|nr:hydrolase [Opitutae bacterium]
MSMNSPKLLLWDLDETLISTDGAGERAFERAALSAFGETISMNSIDYSGQTDRLIGILIQRSCNLAEDIFKLEQFLEDFLGFLPEELPRGNPRVLPGVQSLTSLAFQTEGMAQGLLTGNLAAGANIKLSYFGLWERFSFGAFADDADERDHLGPIALQRANDLHGMSFPPEQTVVIGDTLRDIACAQAFGARSLAVASGKCSQEEFRTAGADCVVDSLEDERACDFLGLSSK